MITTQIGQLKLKDAWTLSRNSSLRKNNVFVTIEKNGVIGIGEAAPNTRYGESAAQTVEVIGRISSKLPTLDFFDYGRVKDFLDVMIVDQNCARAALDMAILDWVGKCLEKPVGAVLGVQMQTMPLTSYSIGIDAPEAVKRKVAEAAEYPILKIKVGTDHDKEIIAAVRSVTDKPIRVDANEGWGDKEVAIRNIEWLSTQGVEFIEQPMPSAMLAETAWLRQRAGVPLIADEAVINAGDIPALREVYDGINIKLMKAGGVQEALAMIHIARDLGLKIMLGCMIESSLAITAAAHLSPLVDWADLDGNLLIANDPYQGVEVVDGRLVLPTEPGIGVAGSRLGGRDDNYEQESHNK